MTIRGKLILSNVAMIVVPALLAAATVFLIFHAAVRSGDAGFSPASRYGPSAAGDGWTNGFLFTVSQAPGLLADERFLAETDGRLETMNAALVVERGGRLAYVSPRLGASADGSDLLRRLALDSSEGRAGHGPPWASGPTLEWNGAAYGIAMQRINATDAAAASNAAAPEQTVYLLVDRSSATHFYRTFVPALFLSLLLGIALTNGLLAYFVSRSIVRPLNALKRAAQRIKEGDLDQALEIRKDEIGQAMGAFEEMRLRLRDSLASQLQYEENRRQLLSSVSHDLRTPIAAISACVEGLQSGIADSKEKQHRYMEMIRRKTADMSRMIEELFLFSKLDLQRVPFDLETVDLNAYLTDVAEEWRHDPRMAGVDLRLEGIGRSPALVKADREKLGRALANVMDNSLKHMDKADKTLTIGLRIDDGRTATVLVRDNGRGIGERELPHIFERFYRADPSRGADTGGSGLGLAIVKQIMEGHGGKAEAASEEGVGTTIALALPLASSEVPGEEASPEKGGGTNAGANSDH